MQSVSVGLPEEQLIIRFANLMLRNGWKAFLVCSTFATPGVLVAQRPVLPLLTRVEQVSELTPREAKLGYPVHLQGVVTVSDRRPRLFYIQDETGGIYVDLHGRKSEPLLGDRVEIFGTSNHMGTAPFVLNDRVKVLGKAEFPKTLPAPPTELVPGKHEGRLVELEGAVVSVRPYFDSHALALRVGDLTTHALLLGTSRLPTKLTVGTNSCLFLAHSQAAIPQRVAWGRTGMTRLRSQNRFRSLTC